jgi:hypothetical protein
MFVVSFIIKGYSEIFAPLLSHIFYISFLQGQVTTLWKHAAIMPVLKKCNSALIIDQYQLKKILQNFSVQYVTE